MTGGVVLCAIGATGKVFTHSFLPSWVLRSDYIEKSERMVEREKTGERLYSRVAPISGAGTDNPVAMGLKTIL